jgi:hypothetical protein
VGAWSDLNLSFCTVMMRKVPQQQEVAPDHVLVALKFVHGEHHRCIWRRSNTENLRTEMKKTHILQQVNIWTLVLTYWIEMQNSQPMFLKELLLFGTHVGSNTFTHPPGPIRTKCACYYNARLFALQMHYAMSTRARVVRRRIRV